VKHPLDNQTVDWVGPIINTGSMVALNQEIAVGRSFNILYFAAHQTQPFQSRDVAHLVDEISSTAITRYLNTLVKLGMLEKVTCIKYQATALAKKMMNVGDNNE
jgi:DNA-binding HxlR family transcriptional regulator